MGKRAASIRTRAAILAGTLLAGAGLAITTARPVIGQPAAEQAPRQLLPGGFGAQSQPAPARPAAPSPPTLPGTASAPARAASAAPDTASQPSSAQPGLDSGEPPLAGVLAPGALPGGPTGPDPFASGPRQDAARTGIYTVASGGWGEAVFAASNGRFLASLARRLNAPIASRWASIALRNAMLSRAQAPADISAGDWVAARAWLLMRMGEIDGARALLDGLPIEAHTTATVRIAGQVALASADLGALCPLARQGRQMSADTLWELALGMCAALEGDDISAAALFDSMRNRQSQSNPGISPFDVRLGERVAIIAGGGGRATNIEWNEAPPLTPFRFGVATAAGVAIPPAALEALGPARHGWIVRQPGIAPDIRMAAFGPAAVLGTVSAAEYVSGVAALGVESGTDSPPALLRTAFAGAGAARRVAAMKAIWALPVPGLSQEAARYAGLIQTAPAAARLPVSDAVEADAPDIIASLLAAGYTRQARAWWPVADKAGGAVRARAWALLAVSGLISATPDAFSSWRSDTDADDRAAARLYAMLSGLGFARGGGWPSDLLPGAESGWSRAIAAAGSARRPGEVALLAATGLQGQWADVPPLHLLRITEALTRAGRSADARRIAAEAVTRF